LILWACFFSTVACACSAFAATERKPNVIIIFIDDQGYEDLGVFGSPTLKTPNVDRMAHEGMRFTDFYSAAAVCTPSRAALLTGCYAERVGDLTVLFPDDDVGLNSDETTIAEMLGRNGYATACVGKWHLGHLSAFLPTNHGFDSYFGIPYSNDMKIADNMQLSDDLVLREGVTMESIWTKKKNWVPLMQDEEVVEYPADQSTLTKRFTDEAIRFIERNVDEPFFLYLAHTMPHVPLFASPQFDGTSEIGLYGDCIEEIDWNVGRIMESLKEQGVDENTLVVYTSDNGPWHFEENATDKVKGNKNRRTGGSAYPLRGYKFQRWEGGMRVPAVMRWPGRIPAGTVCSELVATIDLLPTIAELSPGSVLPKKKIDGKSIAPLLEGQEGAKTPHDAYFYGTAGVRSGNWKLKRNKDTKQFELYDLSADISEDKDETQNQPDIADRLMKLLDDHKQELITNMRPPGQSGSQIEQNAPSP
jgi:arylsulfatase A-like enzyme